MTYLDLLEVLESAATAAGSTSTDAYTYFRGRQSDVSLASVTSNTNLIYVLDTMRGDPDTDNRMERWGIRVGFFRQDSTSSESMEANQVQTDEESREIIFSETLKLAKAFYSALYNEDSIQLTGSPRYSQLTRQLGGTFTGWGLDFEVWLDVGCDDVTIQDAIYQNDASPTFQQSIKRGEVYTAPKITVTDSNGDVYQQNANEDVVCTPGGVGGTCTYDVIINGVSQGTISVTNCEPITLTVP